MWEGKSQARSQRVYIAKKKERKKRQTDNQISKQMKLTNNIMCGRKKPSKQPEKRVHIGQEQRKKEK